LGNRIEDYAFIGDCQSVALVSRSGSVDWLCLPRFDSGACFAALLGNSSNGYFQISPSKPRSSSRKYIDGTLVLETLHEAEEGTVKVTDFMPLRTRYPDMVRIVSGVRGDVAMELKLSPRFDYGRIIPWAVSHPLGCQLIAGPDMLCLETSLPLTISNELVSTSFRVKPNETYAFVLTWHPSHEPRVEPFDVGNVFEETITFWRQWSQKCQSHSQWHEAVKRSLITLKALTYSPTGGIVAAPTTSLPEQIGGPRNWDYRYCWVRDATFTLYALINAGYIEEARDWRNWLLRAVAGEPNEMQIMYGIGGERRLTELELGWLEGYERSSPVRIGNAAFNQLQLDVYGEVMDTLHLARRSGVSSDEASWQLQQQLVEFVASSWQKPDEGIWEVRGPKRHFTHSKVMAWVAVDRAVKACQQFSLPGPIERWENLRDAIHREVCERGFDSKRSSFVQYYGGKELDASLLMLVLVGFLPPEDPRILGTIRAIERSLCQDGFVLRYEKKRAIDGLPPGEGAFLACSFWLADNYALTGRREQAVELFENLLSLRNDVGLLAEEYDPILRRQVGNFPQAFSHIGLVNTARNLISLGGPAEDRKRCGQGEIGSCSISGSEAA
jgi:GH15 family glucan-1,4-alpha-glucosidase